MKIEKNIYDHMYNPSHPRHIAVLGWYSDYTYSLAIHLADRRAGLVLQLYILLGYTPDRSPCWVGTPIIHTPWLYSRQRIHGTRFFFSSLFNIYLLKVGVLLFLLFTLGTGVHFVYMCTLLYTVSLARSEQISIIHPQAVA